MNRVRRLAASDQKMSRSTTFIGGVKCKIHAEFRGRGKRGDILNLLIETPKPNLALGIGLGWGPRAEGAV